MANKQFGVKEFTLIGSSGSPSLTSPNNINLNANTVAISTNATVGGNVTVNNNLTSNNIIVTNLNVTGVTTITTLNATTIIGSGSTSNVRTDSLTVSGISTFAGITTVTGQTLFAKQVNVSGVSTFTGGVRSGDDIVLGTTLNSNKSLILGGTSQTAQLYYNSASTRNEFSGTNTDFYIRAKNYTFTTGPSGFPAETAITITQDGAVSLYYDDAKKFETIGAGVTITGTTFTNQLNVSGVGTFNSLLKILDSTFTGTYEPNRISFRTGEVVIDSVSHTLRFQPSTTDNNGSILFFSRTGATAGSLRFRNSAILDFDLNGSINVSGVSTLSSNVSVGGTISVDGGVKLATNNATIVGTSGTAGEIKRIGGAPFFYDGSAWREFVLSSGTPVSVPADTEWDNVVFRATFDDNFTDAKFSASPVYIGAGSSIVGAAVTIGTGSLRLDGVAGAGISYAYRSDYNFTGSWTIEFWMYHDSVDNMITNGDYAESIVSFGSTSPSGPSPGFFSLAITRDNFANIRFRWYNQNNGSNPLELSADSGVAYSLNSVDKWRHYALVREGDNGSLHFYIDGREQSQTINDAVIDNNILNEVGAGLWFGSTPTGLTVQNDALNVSKLDAFIDDVRISCGVGTAGQRYTSVGSISTTTFTPPTTQLPITGTLSSVVNPPGDKYGEITLGGSPTWRGTSGVTVSQQSSGNYRVSFASSYTNANDYYVLSQGMDQGFASYVGIARSTTHVDLAINRQSNDAAVDTGALAVQIKNHI